VQDDVQQRTVDVQAFLLADLCNQGPWFAFHPEVGQQEKHPCEALLTGVEQLPNGGLLRARVSHSGSLLVLIVDDDENLRVLAGKALVRAGHSVLEADNGDEGLKLVDIYNSHLVLLDLNMPGMDGFEVLRRLFRACRATLNRSPGWR